ncbi:class I tRNA ligase family protein [Nannocystis pusilla]
MAPGEGTDRQRRLLHKTIAAVSERIDRLAFNTAISAMMVYVRDIAQADEPLPRDSLEQFVLLLSPFAPHLAEEIWRSLGHVRSLAYEPWPAADDAWLTEDTFPLVVQIGGKRRAELQVAVGISEADVVKLVMSSSELARYLEGKTPRRVVYVPGKLVNVVL